MAASLGNADHLGAPLDLAVDALARIGSWREAHVGEDVLLGLVQKGGELGQPGAHLIGHLAPRGLGGAGVVLSKRGGDEGRDDAPAALAGMGEGVAQEVHPRVRPQAGPRAGSTALPGAPASQRRPPRSARSGARNTRAPAALMPSCASEITSLTPARPRRSSRRRNSTQKVSAAATPLAMPSTSRRPSVLAATAMVTATETIRPASRTFTTTRDVTTSGVAGAAPNRVSARRVRSAQLCGSSVCRNVSI